MLWDWSIVRARFPYEVLIAMDDTLCVNVVGIHDRHASRQWIWYGVEGSLCDKARCGG